nr:hypothetical protein GCM10020093_116750 [Planobispora longispora]
MDLGPDSIVRIGGSCSIGRGSHIVGHQSIDIGDHVFTGPYVYITDQNHVYDDPEMPIGRQWPRNKPVSIGSGSWLGTGAIILPGTRIGRQCVVAGGAVVRGEFPDHSVIAGIPAKVVRRYTPGEGWQPPHLNGVRPGSAEPSPAELLPWGSPAWTPHSRSCPRRSPGGTPHSVGSSPREPWTEHGSGITVTACGPRSVKCSMSISPSSPSVTAATWSPR